MDFDYAAALTDSNALMNAVPHDVGIILDLSASRSVPSNPLHNLRAAVGGRMPDNWTMTVVIGGSTFVNALANIMSRGTIETTGRVVTANTLAAAHDMILKKQQGKG